MYVLFWIGSLGPTYDRWSSQWFWWSKQYLTVGPRKIRGAHLDRTAAGDLVPAEEASAAAGPLNRRRVRTLAIWTIRFFVAGNLCSFVLLSSNGACTLHLFLVVWYYYVHDIQAEAIAMEKAVRVQRIAEMSHTSFWSRLLHYLLKPTGFTSIQKERIKCQHTGQLQE